MKIYLRAKDIPELANLSRAERCKVWRHCFWKMYGFWQFWVGLSVFSVFAMLGDFIGLVLRYSFGFSEAVSFACTLVGMVIGGLIYGWIHCTAVIERLRPYLREHIAANPASS